MLSCTGWWEEVNLRPVLVLGGPRACSPSPSEVLVWSPLCRNWGAGFFFFPRKKRRWQIYVYIFEIVLFSLSGSSSSGLEI